MPHICNTVGKSLTNLVRPGKTNFRASLRQATMRLFHNHQADDLANAGAALRLVGSLHAQLVNALAEIVQANPANFTQSKSISEQIEFANLRLTCQVILTANGNNRSSFQLIVREETTAGTPPQVRQEKFEFAVKGMKQWQRIYNRLAAIDADDFVQIDNYIKENLSTYMLKEEVPSAKLAEEFCVLIGMGLVLAAITCGLLGQATAALVLLFSGIYFPVLFIPLLTKPGDGIIGQIRDKVGYWLMGGGPTQERRLAIEKQLLALIAGSEQALPRRLKQLKIDLTPEVLRAQFHTAWSQPDTQQLVYQAANGKEYIFDLVDVVSQTTLGQVLREQARLNARQEELSRELASILVYYLPPLGKSRCDGGIFKIFVGESAIDYLRHKKVEPSTKRKYNPNHEIQIYFGKSLLHQIAPHLRRAAEIRSAQTNFDSLRLGQHLASIDLA
jgi:hypothetical protein